jgi:hypothetical protein
VGFERSVNGPTFYYIASQIHYDFNLNIGLINNKCLFHNTVTSVRKVSEILYATDCM